MLKKKDDKKEEDKVSSPRTTNASGSMRRPEQEAEKIRDWITKGVVDALKQGYLRQILFCIYAGVPNTDNPGGDTAVQSTLLESYNFDFTYPSSGNLTVTSTTTIKGSDSGTSVIASSSSVKEQAKGMIR
jgi:hypothetical protein